MFSSRQFPRRFMSEEFDGILIAEPVAANHRIVEVIVKTVVVLYDARSATFCCDSVTAHGINFGY
jgi:hypothetical protein